MYVEGRHPSTQHFAPLFQYTHLPEHLQAISAEAHNLAASMVAQLEDGPELSAGLRHLLEAKDCFVRQQVLDNKKNRIKPRITT